MADLAALAVNAGQFISQSELHGAVCGLAAGGAGRNADGCAGGDLLRELMELLGSDALTDAASVDAFVQASLPALFADDLSFQPLLPEDEAPIAVRVQAIAEWCGAFAAGYGAAHGARAGRLSPREAVNRGAQEDHPSQKGTADGQGGSLSAPGIWAADHPSQKDAATSSPASSASPSIWAVDHPSPKDAADEQADELLRDFVAISGAVLDDEDDGAEVALVELQEYAKVGALLLAAGMRQAEEDGRD